MGGDSAVLCKFAWGLRPARPLPPSRQKRSAVMTKKQAERKFPEIEKDAHPKGQPENEPRAHPGREPQMKTEPKPPFPAQHQAKPGIEAELTPRPNYQAPRYKPSGK